MSDEEYKNTIKIQFEMINELTKRNKELEDGFKAATDELCEYATKIDKAIEYNEHLIRDAKYHLNLGHLKKMKKILLGDKE